MTSLGHQVFGARKVFVYCRTDAQSNREKCHCLSCKSTSTGYKFNTTSTEAAALKRLKSKKYTAAAPDICKVRDPDGIAFWANSRCVVAHPTWTCACYNCTKSAKNSDSASDSDPADIDLIVHLKNLKVSQDVVIEIKTKKQ